ncbi:MAG: hypothetical protein Kow0026_08410 [Oricola sp.]
MNAQAFHNALRIMRGLDAGDLYANGVADENWGRPEASSRDQIAAFMADPYTEAIRMPDANFERLCELIEQRQPRHLKEG